jgi:hypothetical protein
VWFYYYCIPDLKLDGLLTDRDHLGSEFNSDGYFVLLPETVVDELQEEAGFADA